MKSTTITIDNICALEKIKKEKDNSLDIIFADPPYALGSKVIIKDSKPIYEKATDFMSKWKMPDENFWEEFFIEAQRVLKYGGRVLFFGMDRQLMLFQYYAAAANLETKQSLYWFYINSFPKATDLSQKIDSRLGTERKIIGKRNDFSLDGAVRDPNKHKEHLCNVENDASHKYGYKKNPWDSEVTVSNSELGQKYEGQKYGVAPFKQVLETIMIFQKPYKNKSMLDDVLAFENGDETISPSCWFIDNGRVPTNDSLDGGATTGSVVSQEGFDRPWMHDGKSLEEHQEKMKKKVEFAQQKGRFPSQLFVDENIAERLDEQSGILTSGKMKAGTKYGQGQNQNCYGTLSGCTKQDTPGDSGGCSRILHVINLLENETNLTIYTPKVSTSERNIGLDNFEEKSRSTLHGPDTTNKEEMNDVSKRFISKPVKNNHPTLKPIKLIYQIAKLLKTENNQKVFFPFSGSGSEIIGFLLAGFDGSDFTCSELSSDYIDIANARIDYWKDVDIEKYIDKNIIETPEKQETTSDCLF